MDNKTNFILGPKSYMFWHQGAIPRGFIKRRIISTTCTEVLVAPAVRTFSMVVWKDMEICDAVLRMAWTGR